MNSKNKPEQKTPKEKLTVVTTKQVTPPDTPTDEKKPLVLPSLTSSFTTRMMAKRGKGNLVRTRICYAVTASTSAANTANTGNAAVQPALASEWTNFVSLFRAVRVTGGRYHYMIQIGNTSSSANITTQAWAVVCFDAQDSTALTGVDQGMEHSNHHLYGIPMNNPNAGGTGTYNLPNTSVIMTRRGFETLGFRVPRNDMRTSGSTFTALTAGWMNTNDSADVWGYIKWYIPALATTTTTRIDHYFELDCEFQYRA
jgi:hypothetical protein